MAHTEEEAEQSEENDESRGAEEIANQTEGGFIDKKPRKSRKQKTKEKDIPLDSKGQKKHKVIKSRKEKDHKGRTSECIRAKKFGSI